MISTGSLHSSSGTLLAGSSANSISEVTDIETEKISKGLSEEIVRLISSKKEEPEFLLKFRLKAYRHWLTLEEPDWAELGYDPIDY